MPLFLKGCSPCDPSKLLTVDFEGGCGQTSHSRGVQSHPFGLSQDGIPAVATLPGAGSSAGFATRAYEARRRSRPRRNGPLGFEPGGRQTPVPSEGSQRGMSILPTCVAHARLSDSSVTEKEVTHE